MDNQSLAKEDQTRHPDLAEAEKYFKEACEIFQRESTRLRLEQEAIDSMSRKLENVLFSSTVKLNVGGHHFTTSVQTLTKDPNSMLAAMFSGKFEMRPSEDGSFFIDRDGTHFRFILNYLRHGELILPDSAAFLKELEAEAKFYQIQGILNQMKLAFEQSEILTDEDHRRVLKGWLPPQKGEWRLLFRASRDGFAVKTFHTKCDNKGPTVSIVQNGRNIFGGFTELSWKSQGEYVTCKEAFLFSMVNPQGLGPTKMPLVKNQDYAMYCDSNLGPTFGGGHDLHTGENANKTASSYSQLGYSYESPPGGQQEMFFTGVRNFIVTNYEVYGFHQ
ncbi:BTB/POZ domain-containing adapter for CUL3-mediated RhoA degradation protein 3-like [Oculina patagonica]